MHVRRTLIVVFVILAALALVGSVSAADDGSGEPPGLSSVLEKGKTVVFDYVLKGGGFIAFGAGVAAWAFGNSGDTVQKGKKFIIGGAVAFVFGIAPDKVAAFLEWFGTF